MTGLYAGHLFLMMAALCLASVIGGKISGGFAGFGALAFVGWRLLRRGFHKDIFGSDGYPYAPRWSFIAAGILLQFPLFGWIVFLIHQGWFDRQQPINFLSH